MGHLKKHTSKKLILSACFLFVISMFTETGIFAQDIPEEAQKHLARGKAAVEMAKNPEDYKAAITEFQQAIQIAPTWGEPHYQLGLAYEKMEKYSDAIASLKRYVELAPDAENVKEVKELIYKLEFKAEQTPTVSDIIDIMVNMYNWDWSETGERVVLNSGFYLYNLGKIEKVGENSVRVPFNIKIYNTPNSTTYQTLEITGPKIKIDFFSDSPWVYSDTWLYADYSQVFAIEIISKAHVKLTRTVKEVRTGKIGTCNYDIVKKTK